MIFQKIKSTKYISGLMPETPLGKIPCAREAKKFKFEDLRSWFIILENGLCSHRGW